MRILGPGGGSRVTSVCVFCGARRGRGEGYAALARRTADALADRGLGLVYGGGNVGLMGVLADRALERGVHVTGVIPRSMVEVELAHRGVQRLIVVADMHERKLAMARESDAILVLPGGVGTLDELFEAMTWNQLKIQRKPIAVVNAGVGTPGVGVDGAERDGAGGLARAGFYDGLVRFLKEAQVEGFVLGPTMDMFHVAECPESAVEGLVGALSPGGVSGAG